MRICCALNNLVIQHYPNGVIAGGYHIHDYPLLVYQELDPAALPEELLPLGDQPEEPQPFGAGLFDDAEAYLANRRFEQLPQEESPSDSDELSSQQSSEAHSTDSDGSESDDVEEPPRRRQRIK